MADLNLLMDMGFPQQKAEKALSVTGNKGVEAAMEWLLAHQDELDDHAEGTHVEVKKESDEHNGAEKSDVDELQALTEELAAEAKCIKCDECNKKFRTDSEIEFHAVKTGHQSFSESAEEIKPLSEEERKEQMRKLESIIKQRRQEKAEQEKKEALEREKSRRRTGQELTQARQKLQEEEIRHMAEMKRREKMEDKLARQRVLDEIERDKQRRKEKFGMGGASAPTPAPNPIPAPVVMSPPASSSNQTFDECKLQIRLTNGQCLTQTFSPNEELAAVRLFVEMNRTDGSGAFSLMTNFPKKVFSESDMQSSLCSLGLVPSAVLIVSKKV